MKCIYGTNTHSCLTSVDFLNTLSSNFKKLAMLHILHILNSSHISGRYIRSFLRRFIFPQKFLVPDDYLNSRISQNPCPFRGFDFAETTDTPGIA